MNTNWNGVRIINVDDIPGWTAQAVKRGKYWYPFNVIDYTGFKRGLNRLFNEMEKEVRE